METTNGKGAISHYLFVFPEFAEDIRWGRGGMDDLGWEAGSIVVKWAMRRRY